MIIYQSWKFHENRPNRFREILCTKSVRKKKIIRIEKKKQYNNNKVFRWKRKTLIKPIFNVYFNVKEVRQTMEVSHSSLNTGTLPVNCYIIYLICMTDCILVQNKYHVWHTHECHVWHTHERTFHSYGWNVWSTNGIISINVPDWSI